MALVGGLAAPLDAAHAQLQIADVSISASDSPDPVAPDGDVTYTVTVTNTGPDAVPATVGMANGGTLRFQSLTSPAGWSCSAPPVGAAPSVTCSNASFAVGSQVFTMVANADSSLLGVNDTTFQSSFDISTPAFDPIGGNDSATVTTTYSTPDADLAVVLSGPPTAAHGAQITYTYTVTNNGPDTAPDVVVSDAPQPGMTFVSLTAAAGFSCTTPAVGAEGPVVCTKAAMASGDSADFTLVAVTPPSGPAALNAVAVASAIGDPNLSNNNAIATTLLTSSQPQIASVSPSTGPSSGGTAVTITGQNFTGATAVQFGGVAAASFTVNSASSIGAVTPAGSGAAAVAVTTAAGTATSPAAFTYIAGPSLNAAAPSGAVYAGDPFDVTFTVTNDNAVALQGVTLSWVTPSGLTLGPVTPSQGTASGLTATLGALAAGASATVTVRFTAAGSGAYSVDATAAATNGGPANQASAAGAILPSSDVAVTISAPANAQPGAALTFNITASNNGADAASNVQLTSALPASLTFQSLSAPSGWSCTTPAVGANGTVTCSRPTFSAAGSGAFTLVTTVDSGASGALSTTASISTSTNDVTASDNSASASVTITHLAPTADDMAVSVTYQTATLINLDVDGAVTSVAVGAAPAHGSAVVSGSTVTYTPANGYFGADSFTYTATGPGGTSAAATVTITVATPAAPVVGNVSSVAVSYNSTGTAIQLPVTGVFTSVSAPTGPSHGAVVMAGSVATYTPTAGYFGADSFTYTATGPGGTSTTGTVTLVVAAPGVPTVQSPAPIALTITQAQPAPTAVINLSAQVSGVFTAISVATQPQHGAVSLATTPRPGQTPLVVATYTADSDYAGADSFTFVATGPGGDSTPGTVTLNIGGTTPVLALMSVVTPGGVSVSVDLTTPAGEGPFTDADIVSVSPTGSGTATLAEGGTEGARTYQLQFQPLAGFTGPVVVTYTLSNRFGASAQGTVLISVAARANPASDYEVRGVIGAMSMAATGVGLRVFDSAAFHLASDLISGESDESDEAEESDESEEEHKKKKRAARRSLASSLQFNGLSDLPAPDLDGPFPGFTARFEAEHARDDWFLNITAPQAAQDAGGGGDSPKAEPGPQGPAKTWVGGSITFGRREGGTGKAVLDIVTSGVVAGVDVRLNRTTVVGAGVGYGRDIIDVGREGSRVETRSWMGFAYGSLKPVDGLFLNGVLGAGELNFDIDRAVTTTDAMTTAKRDGDLLFGGVVSGFERREETWGLSSYGRLAFSHADLGEYAEQGGGLDNLSYASRKVRSLVGGLGVRGEVMRELRSGIVMPRVRLEVLHEFEEESGQEVRYADWLGGPAYLVQGDSSSRDRIRLGVGNSAVLQNGWTVDFDAEAEFAEDQVLGTFRLKAEKAF